MRIFLFIFSVLFFLSCTDYDESEIQSFIETNLVLQKRVKERSEENKNTLHRIEIEVRDSGNDSTGISLLKNASAVRLKSANLVQHIQVIKDSVIKSEKWLDSLSADLASEKYKLDQKMVTNLNDSINSFIQLVKPYSSINIDSVFSAIRLSGSINVSLLLIELNTISLKLLREENKILALLLKKIKSSVLFFDRVYTVVRPESNVVEQGKYYSAEVFLIAAPADPDFIKKITFEGKSIPVYSNGSGQVSFVAKAEKFDKDGLAKKKWNGSVSIRMKGRDTTFNITEEYFVRKKCN
ncbi:MAG: hypothetical protein K2X86_13125 [Cytophagaceae bacterium]|nr:hypothetical protein [Cytophagaceae bacterium]